jgi:hypothetical protein
MNDFSLLRFPWPEPQQVIDCPSCTVDGMLDSFESFRYVTLVAHASLDWMIPIKPVGTV